MPEEKILFWGKRYLGNACQRGLEERIWSCCSNWSRSWKCEKVNYPENANSYGNFFAIVANFNGIL
jgi:hypothetical protein